MAQLLLVRHGQASWGAADYDVLSATGWEQGRMLGRALAARGVAPTYVVRGAMRRHRETLEAIGLPETTVDHGWDEFDSRDVFASVPPAPEGQSRAEFHAWFETAMERWTGGDHDADYAEPFGVFTARVAEALRRTADATGPGTALVVTSGGPISWCAASLLGDRLDHPSQVALSRTLNPICANSGVTKVVAGRRGMTLVSFNEHTHLEPRLEMITYR